MPTLKADFVIRRMHRAIMAEEKEVFIQPIIFWLKIVLQLLPLQMRNYCLNLLVGQGMEYFKGRCEAVIKATQETKKDSARFINSNN